MQYLACYERLVSSGDAGKIDRFPRIRIIVQLALFNLPPIRRSEPITFRGPPPELIAMYSEQVLLNREIGDFMLAK